MDRATDEIFPPQKRPRTGGLQGETERTGPSSQSASFYSHGTGDQFNAPDGTINNSTGSGNHFTGAEFSGPVYFGTNERFDPLRECLRSLAFPEMDSRSYDIDAAAKGTCAWLPRHKTYKSWASCDRGLLWIKGKPGSGKSTLLWNVLNDVTPRLKTGEGVLILAFFFHGRGSELQKTPFGLFRSLHHQLLRQVSEALTDLMATFQERCETVGKPGEKWQWHQRELQRFLELSLPRVLETRPVWLFVDALDECGKENAVKLVELLKSLLQGLPSRDLKEFRICFTCRHYPILDLGDVLEVCLEDENREDIATFVQHELSSFRERRVSTIPDLITERAEGVFLWAMLVVKRVLDLELEGAGLKKIEAEIFSVPSELDALYHQLIQSMSSDSLKLIQWICFATRPLSLDELRWAMLVDADCPHRSLYECQNAGDYPFDDDGMKRRIQTLSCGLAEVTSDAKVVQFIHQSVKDFFVEKGLSALDETTKPDFIVGSAHHRLSRTCIRYLAMEEIGQSTNYRREEVTAKFPFLHYAITSWVAHTKESDAISIAQEDLVECFAGPSNALVERWVHIYRILERHSNGCPPEGTSLVHVMSRYGVVRALRTILGRAKQVGINIDGKDSDGRTPLSWAAGGGHEEVVQILLKMREFDVSQWRRAVARTLLRVVSKVNVDRKDRGRRTPLSWAAEGGHEAIARLLIDGGADINAADQRGWTPLSHAAEGGHEATVRVLINKGANINAADNWGWTPLRRAAEGGHEAIARLLVDGSLSRAAEGGHEAIARLLVDGGADINAADNWGRTPLRRAAEGGHEAIARLLVDGSLSRAAERGHEAIARLLVDRGRRHCPLSTTLR